MIVPQEIINNIQSTMTVRTMRLPVVRGPLGELIVPARAGNRYGLQVADFQPAQARIVVTEVYREPIAALALSEARREGHSTIQAAVDAYVRLFGEVDETTVVWVVHFARDAKDGSVSDHVKCDDPVLLATNGGYTNLTSHAVRGEAEVLHPLQKAMDDARAKAREKRLSPERRAVRKQIQETETLRYAMTAMKNRNRLARALRELEKVDEDLAAEEAATLHPSERVASPASAAVEGDPWPSDTESPVSLEPAA
jgi:hypothetical protein